MKHAGLTPHHDYSRHAVCARGFALIGVATMASDHVTEKLAKEVDALKAIDEARKKK